MERVNDENYTDPIQDDDVVEKAKHSTGGSDWGNYTEEKEAIVPDVNDITSSPRMARKNQRQNQTRQGNKSLCTMRMMKSMTKKITTAIWTPTMMKMTKIHMTWKTISLEHKVNRQQNIVLSSSQQKKK